MSLHIRWFIVHFHEYEKKWIHGKTRGRITARMPHAGRILKTIPKKI